MAKKRQQEKIIRVSDYYKPLPAQAKFHELLARPDVTDALYVGGFGSGKSMAGTWQAIDTAMRYPGSVGLIARATIPEIKDTNWVFFFEQCPKELIRRVWRNDRRVELINGSVILFRSLDQADRKLKSLTLDWFWVDELTEISEDDYVMLVGRRRGKVGPRKSWGTTNPNGHDWVWRRWVKEPMPGHTWVRGSTLENHYLPEDYIRSLKENLNEQEQQRYIYGEFVVFGDLIYSEFDPSVHVVSSYPERFLEVIAGKDWGYVEPGATIVIGVGEDETFWVIHEEYRPGLLIEDWLKIDLELRERFGISVFFANPPERENFAVYEASGLPIRPANNSIWLGIDTIKRLLRRNQLKVHESCTNLIAEFQSYHRKKQGENTLEVPADRQQDHALDALRYAIASYQVASLEARPIPVGLRPSPWADQSRASFAI